MSFLVDAADYFEALESALRKARRQILILAWDFHSELKLLGPEADPEEHLGIMELIENLLEETPDLEAYLLLWDPAIIYAAEREPFPKIKLGRQSHPRFHFHLDTDFPPGAAQHQKVVVIDDSVAFIGGIDLTKRRWDTSDHRPGHPNRIEEDGNEYRPFHDVQVLVFGDIARDLGEMARDRIWNAGSTRVEPPKIESDPWPSGTVPHLEDVTPAVVRTQSAWKELPERRDCLEAYRRIISEARRYIYIENQHFTSQRVTKMLAESLSEPDGPEIVMLLPRRAGGWLEHGAMGTQRARMVMQLREADRHGRFNIFHPHVDGLSDDLWIHVHSKLVIADDRVVMIGSTNLANRSLSLDTEADLGIESNGEARIEAGIKTLLSRLLAEHLGSSEAEVKEAMEQGSSLRGAIDMLAGGSRTLLSLKPDAPEAFRDIITDGYPFDPEEPISAQEMVANLASVESGATRGRPLLRTGILLLAAGVLAALWRYTPVSGYLDPATLVAWAGPVRESALAPLVAVSVFVLGGLVAFPVLVLILASGIAFGPVYGLVYALLGCIASAAVGYMVGKRVGKGALRRLAGTRVDKVSKALARRGIISVAAIRMVPLAPFTVVNMAAGASHIRLRDFLAGTFIGMAPGIVLITLFGYGIAQAIAAGKIGWIIAILMIPAALLGLGLWIKRIHAGRKAVRPIPPESAQPEPQEAD